MIDITLQAKLDPKRAIMRQLLDEREFYGNKLVGLNVSQLRNFLKISRPTISKYCKVLYDEGKVLKKELGRNVIYYARKYDSDKLDFNGRV